MNAYIQESQADEMAGLGANERAILSRIRWGPARRLAIRLVRLKMRLQFTGWLQYLLPLPSVLVLGLLGALSWLLGLSILATGLLVPACLVATVAIVNVIMIKFRIRLPERRPPGLEGRDTLDVIRARRSCRSFQVRPMATEDRAAIMASVERHLQLPTIGTVQPRLEYIAAPLTVWPTVNASEFLVAIVPKAYDRTAIIDVGRTLQRVVIDATAMGVATCWIGPGADHESIVRHLGDRFDPTQDHIVCVCAVGYRSRYIPLFIRVFNWRMSTRRLPLGELVFEGSPDRPVDVAAQPHRRFAVAYEACRWSPSSYNGQTTRAVVHTDASTVRRVDFLASTSSRFYAPVALGIWCANWELSCESLGVRGRFETVDLEDETVPRHDVSWVQQSA